MKVVKATIIGGTHGNELTGILLLRKWDVTGESIRRNSFLTQLFWANPKAFFEGKRYIDDDLNRCFRMLDLNDLETSSYERERARTIDAILGYKGEPEHGNFLIDLHTTTSNMGITLIFARNHPYLFMLASYVKKKLPEVKVYYFEHGRDDVPYLISMVPRSLMLEVGPVPQGVVRSDILEKTEAALSEILDFLHNYNTTDGQVEVDAELEVFSHCGEIHYPLDESGQICGIVHPRLQDNDYVALQKNDPLFLTFDGKEILYEGEEIVYPTFVNEAAYYQENIALCLAKKLTIDPKQGIPQPAGE